MQNRWLRTDEIPNVLEGERRMAREFSENYRRQGFDALHHRERQFEEAAASHRWEVERLRQTETARVASQTIAKKHACFYRRENVAAVCHDPPV